jgi:hypothetical protein
LIVFASASDERSGRCLSGAAVSEEGAEAVTAINLKMESRRRVYDSNISANHVGIHFIILKPSFLQLRCGTSISPRGFGTAKVGHTCPMNLLVEI